ncbi:MAG: DNRLRE domain-containing protein, partial [Pirellulales bacterium]
MKFSIRTRRSKSKRKRYARNRKWFGLRRSTLEKLEDRLALAALTVHILDDAISENGGATTAIVTRGGDTAGDLEVDLSSSDTSEATVPVSVTILDGQADSPAFHVSGVDDQLIDGTQTVAIIARTKSQPTTISYRNGAAGTADDNGPQPVGIWVNGAAVKDYAGTHDRTLAGWFNGGGASDPAAAAAVYWTQSWNPQGQTAELVIKFDDIFVDLGQNPAAAEVNAAVAKGEIPLGTTIASAQVRFRNWNLNNGAGNAASIQRLLQDWTEDTVTWNSFGTSGLSNNDGKATAWENGVGQTTVPGDGPSDVMFADVTASMNLMSLGAPNNGWGFIPTGGGFCGQSSTCTRLFSSEHAEQVRPALYVEFAGGPALAPGSDTVDVLDDEVPVAAVNIDPLADLTTTEAGGQATFTVALNTVPTDPVTIALSSSNEDEGTVAPASLTFTAANALTPQTVTVTGVDDNVDDGNTAFSIVTAAATSDDQDYSGLNPANVSVANTDDDAAAIALSGGGTVIFHQGANVVSTDGSVNIPDYDGTQDTYMINAGAFNGGASNFGVSKTLRVNRDTRLSVLRFDVSALDGVFTEINSATLRLYTSAAAATGDTLVYRLADANSAWREGSHDGGTCLGCNTHHATWAHLADFGGFPQPTPTWASGTGGPNVAGTDYDAVPLGSLPNAGSKADATFDIPLGGDLTALFNDWSSTSPTGNGQSPWTADWNWQQPAPQTANEGFLLRGTDGAIHDVHSSEAAVPQLRPQLIVNYGGGVGQLTTTESGGAATFGLALETIPTKDVTIDLSSSDLTEGRVVPASITFTPANALEPQPVTIIGVDDNLVDGDTGYSIVIAAAQSADPNYDGMDLNDLSVTNTDDEVAALTLAIADGEISEAGATTATVGRNTPTTGPLVVHLLSDDTTEATVVAEVTIPAGAASVDFDIDAADDAIVDGKQTVTIVAAAEAHLPASDALEVTDDDTAALSVAIADADVSEAAGAAATRATVSRNTDPTDALSVTLANSDPGEASMPQQVTIPAGAATSPEFDINAVDDAIVDGTQTVVITASADGHDDGSAVLEVTDDDKATLSVTIADADVSEAAGAAATRATVSRNTDPTDALSVTLANSDPGEADVPQQVTIPAGAATSPEFNIDAVDDAIV